VGEEPQKYQQSRCPK